MKSVDERRKIANSIATRITHNIPLPPYDDALLLQRIDYILAFEDEFSGFKDALTGGLGDFMRARNLFASRD